MTRLSVSLLLLFATCCRSAPSTKEPESLFAGTTSPTSLTSSRPVIDVHVHLFGTGDTGSGCHLSETVTRGPLFGLLAVQLGVKRRADTFDEGYVAALVEHVRGSGVDRAVLLAQDGVYDDDGELVADENGGGVERQKDDQENYDPIRWVGVNVM